MRIGAIDQGTTSTRAVVFDADGGAEVVAKFSHHQSYPRPSWVEHDPCELLAHVAAAAEAAAAAGAVAIGLANQGESCLAWDGRTGEPLSPVIVWQDDRTAGACEWLKAHGAEPLVRAATGLPLDPYFSATKLRWLLDEVPAVAAAARAGRLRLATTDAFFRDRLTGRFETDVTTASRTALMNLARREWDQDLCALFGIEVEALPAIGPSAGDLGRLPGGTALAASLVDQQAALYGHGCRQPGDTKITFGTGAFALTVTGSAPPPSTSSAVPTIAWQKSVEPPAYALDGGVYTASSALDWARGLGLFNHWDEVADFGPGSMTARGLAFVPALAGLACPHWNRSARGTWMGLSLDTRPRDMVQALLEGIAFRTAEVIAELGAAVPLRAPISVDGGMSVNAWFCQFLADATGTDIVVAGSPELTASGVAMLAAEAVGSTLPPVVVGRRIVRRPLAAGAHETFARARQAAELFARPQQARA